MLLAIYHLACLSEISLKPIYLKVEANVVSVIMIHFLVVVILILSTVQLLFEHKLISDNSEGVHGITQIFKRQIMMADLNFYSRMLWALSNNIYNVTLTAEN